MSTQALLTIFWPFVFLLSVMQCQKPGPYVKEMNDAAMFYTNRVLKDYKDTLVDCFCVYLDQFDMLMRNDPYKVVLQGVFLFVHLKNAIESSLCFCWPQRRPSCGVGAFLSEHLDWASELHQGSSHHWPRLEQDREWDGHLENDLNLFVFWKCNRAISTSVVNQKYQNSTLTKGSLSFSRWWMFSMLDIVFLFQIWKNLNYNTEKHIFHY